MIRYIILSALLLASPPAHASHSVGAFAHPAIHKGSMIARPRRVR